MKLALLWACAALVVRAEGPFAGASALDEQIERAVQSQLIPGAVLVVGHDGRIVYRKAYGEKALIPKREPMELDTIFDAASLTKVIATTSSMMKLYEDGKVQIDDPVTKYLPEFQGGRSDITIRNLMTHFSGLRPDLDLKPAWSGYDTGIRKALVDKPVAQPGGKFIYSDINFVLLGEIVHRLSGKLLSVYAHEHIFKPLGMKDTEFQPAGALLQRIAPTELDEASGLPIRGVVHDPTSRYMGGVAGHAGMFTTADDLAKFAQMMLDLGVANGTRLFSAATVQLFTSPQSPPHQPILRGLGWDINSPFSSNRGELFPIGSYGHTGFTGTSLWIDPSTRSYVILLTNSVHPHHGKSLSALRSRVATIVAASLGIESTQLATGLDVLEKQHFSALGGKRIGLITNHTGLDREGKRNVDLMLAAGVRIAALFSPEHGLVGDQDQPDVADAKDAVTGLPVHSLYRTAKRRLTPGMLEGIDALVFDIQDVGARFYTYSCTLISSLEEAAKRRIPFYVLDRPNPITGIHVEGPLLDPDLESFTGCFEMPVRHGLTFGELAAMVNGERRLGADLQVVKMEGWHRGDWFDATGLAWVNPSPSMRSLNAATLYPGVAMLEAAKNYSVGRGTDAPFEQVGADWIRGRELARFLNLRVIPGVRAYATKFRPKSSNFQDRTIEGVRFVITDRNAFDSARLGLELGYALEKLYPGKISWDANRFLIGNHGTVEAGKQGKDPRATSQALEESAAAFGERRRKYLLYQ